MSVFSEHQRPPHRPQARKSLFSWKKEAEGEKGAQCGHRGMYGADGMYDSWGWCDRRACRWQPE